MRRRRAVLVSLVILAAAAAAWRWSATRTPIPDDIEAGRQTTPVIGPTRPDGGATVTFYAKIADGRVPRIVSDVTGWGERLDGTFDFAVGTMTRLGATEWYTLSTDVDARARVEYLVAYAPGDYRPDPHNPRRSPGPQFGGAPASEFVLPGYVVPPEFIVPDAVPAGLVAEDRVESAAFGRPCRVFVHTAVGAPRDDAPLVVVLDARVQRLARVVDGLVARGQLSPGITVFVAPEFADGGPLPEGPLRRFLTRELPDWAAVRHGIAARPDRRAIVAVSFGARDALFAALEASAYGRLGVLIPGRRISRDDLAHLAVSGYQRPPLRVTILAGRYDHANAPTARSLREALTAAGHQVDYLEVPEGHSAVTWMTHAGRVLAGVMR